MGLASPVTQWVAIGVACAALVAIVVGWRLLARRGVLALLGRAASLIAVNLTVLVAVFLVVNSKFGLYSDWDDLLGIQSAQSAATTTTSGGGNGGTTTVSDPKAEQIAGYDGRVFRAQVPGPASGVTGTVLVMLPAGYGTKPAPAGGYPVIEAFHGYPGTPQQWLEAMDVMPSVDGAVARRQIVSPILVFPDLEIPAGRDTECVNGGPGEPQLETWMSKDVPDWVESHYQAARTASSWATMGLSMGAWCANQMTMLHPDRFGATISFGGYFKPNFGSWKPFALNSPAGQRLDLVTLAKVSPPAVRVWALASKSDSLSWPSTSALAAAAHGPLQVTMVTQQQGGHRTSIWAGFVPQALDWLGENLQGFAPTSA
ncbi:alpha/beta hydrolase [Kineococcus sp. DHX-1]|uniref:alpha/beta hydrolase n=1 Tax=Kineococcus sp. DHX-1 TaxID=3349638 RepID=UPI0036D2E61A